MPGSVCAIAADEKSTDTVWLVKIFEETVAKGNISDHYCHLVLDGQRYIDGPYLEFHTTTFLKKCRKRFSFTISVTHRTAPVTICFNSSIKDKSIINNGCVFYTFLGGGSLS